MKLVQIWHFKKKISQKNIYIISNNFYLIPIFKWHKISKKLFFNFVSGFKKGRQEKSVIVYTFPINFGKI